MMIRSLCALLVLTCALPALAQTPATEAGRLEANKQLLLKFFALGGDLEARKAMLADDYIQHNPRFVAVSGQLGSQAWMDAIQTARGRSLLIDPDFNLRGTPVVLMAEGDLVTAIFKAVLPDPDDPSKTYEAFNFETVRIKDGKLAEHWDAVKLAQGWRAGLPDKE